MEQQLSNNNGCVAPSIRGTGLVSGIPGASPALLSNEGVTVKKIILALVIACFMANPLYAIDSVYNLSSPDIVKGWHVFAQDADVDSSAMELITALATTYAQLAADDLIQVVSANSNDKTQVVTIYGIDTDGKKFNENITLNGTTAVDSTTTFRYVQEAVVNAKCAGAVTVRRKTGSTGITVIAAGDLEALSAAQRFTGPDYSYVTYWACGVYTTTGNVTAELRWYPNAASSRTDVGYVILDKMFIPKADGSPMNVEKKYSQPLRLPPGGWLSVWGQGGANDSDLYTVIQGFDLKY